MENVNVRWALEDMMINVTDALLISSLMMDFVLVAQSKLFLTLRQINANVQVVLSSMN